MPRLQEITRSPEGVGAGSFDSPPRVVRISDESFLLRHEDRANYRSRAALDLAPGDAALEGLDLLAQALVLVEKRGYSGFDFCKGHSKPRRLARLGVVRCAVIFNSRSTNQNLDTPEAGADRRLVDNRDLPDVAGGVAVGAAAELTAEASFDRLRMS